MVPGEYMTQKVSERSLANLKPRIDSPEKARELQKLGAEAKIRNKAERVKMRDELNTLLKLSLKKGDLVTKDDVLNLEEAQEKNVSVQTAINVAMIQRAIMGDVQAATWVRDTLGEKPTDKVELDQSLTIEAWAKNHDVKL